LLYGTATTGMKPAPPPLPNFDSERVFSPAHNKAHNLEDSRFSRIHHKGVGVVVTSANRTHIMQQKPTIANVAYTAHLAHGVDLGAFLAAAPKTRAWFEGLCTAVVFKHMGGRVIVFQSGKTAIAGLTNLAAIKRVWPSVCETLHPFRCTHDGKEGLREPVIQSMVYTANLGHKVDVGRFMAKNGSWMLEYEDTEGVYVILQECKAIVFPGGEVVLVGIKRPSYARLAWVAVSTMFSPTSCFLPQ